jgi:hypothetical protein
MRGRIAKKERASGDENDKRGMGRGIGALIKW